MSSRRGLREGSLYWSPDRQRWIAEATVGYDGRGKRVRQRLVRRTKTEAQQALRDLVRDVADGQSVDDRRLTVADAVEEWLEYGLSNRTALTRAKARSLCERHVIPQLGKRRLRDLRAVEVERWMAALTEDLSTSTIRQVRSCLSRAVRRAMSQDRVRRNVVELAQIPTGRTGRPSKALTPEQVDAVLEHTAQDRMYGYIVLSLLTGARTEELRALTWDHVYLDPLPIAGRPVPPHIAVWRSVRAQGETKTPKSRRTIALPQLCVDALRKERGLQARDRRSAGPYWRDSGLVFTSVIGTALDAANVRRSFRRALALVPGIDASEWTPRELRHSFVSLLADAHVPVETISQLVGHRGTSVTELVYRHQVRPVIQTGALVIHGRFRSADVTEASG